MLESISWAIKYGILKQQANILYKKKFIELEVQISYHFYPNYFHGRVFHSLAHSFALLVSMHKQLDFSPFKILLCIRTVSVSEGREDFHKPPQAVLVVAKKFIDTKVLHLPVK